MISVLDWPVVRQFRSGDVFGRGPAVMSTKTKQLTARTTTADRVARSVCPYCAVGCGQRVFVKDEKVIQIEGDPASPISRGRLCPKGSASEQLVNSPGRQTTILYRRPHGTEWEPLELDAAIEMVADRFLAARRNGWQDTDDEGRPLLFFTTPTPAIGTRIELVSSLPGPIVTDAGDPAPLDPATGRPSILAAPAP